jgi:uncharacterized protein (TIGR00288 family)
MTETSLAVFIDFENLALAFPPKSKVDVDMERVLNRLLEKGNVLVKKAYADWGRYTKAKKSLHEQAVELIEVPHRNMTGKNSADIRLVVDAMDLAYTKDHITTFVIVSGDSDFSPLVSKLRENGKYVIGVGMRNSTSPLLSENADEFIFYEDLEKIEEPPPPPAVTTSGAKETPVGEIFRLMLRAVSALQRENKEILYASMVKDTMKRMRPSFSETSAGYRSFSDLLEDAEDAEIIDLRTDPRSGTYVVIPRSKKKSRRRERTLD